MSIKSSKYTQKIMEKMRPCTERELVGIRKLDQTYQ
ncbi:hypothetical protein E2C01_093122 [Portunus trituberculatus]|uniref:Uncharacterized protein n=1 Tax=Portunus trituberculatus TaxID=210409 RepID=A0A5B7JLY8_PORTR|nr:hypothetical protein [Portunus trituberculatus]